MSHKLIEKLRSYIDVTEDEERYVTGLFRPEKFAKGEYFLFAGDVCTRAAFVEKGVFRSFINTGDRDATYYFAAENEFICDYPSFLPQHPSSVNIQALEESEIKTISFENLQSLYREVRFGERFGRLIAEEIFVDSIQQLASFYQDDPATRYRNFVDRFPQLVQRLPQYYIASYVGVEPPSLSRIRRRFLSHD